MPRSLCGPLPNTWYQSFASRRRKFSWLVASVVLAVVLLHRHGCGDSAVGFAYAVRNLKYSGGQIRKVTSKHNLMRIIRDKSSHPQRRIWATKWMKRRKYFKSNFEYRASMIAMTNAGSHEEALELWQDMKDRGMEVDKYTHSAAIVALQSLGQWRDAMRTLEELMLYNKVPTSVACTHALAALEKGGKWKLSLALMEEMRYAGMDVKTDAYMPAIRACENAAEYEVGNNLFQELRAQMKLEAYWDEEESKLAQTLRLPPPSASKDAGGHQETAPNTPWRVPNMPIRSDESAWEQVQREMDQKRAAEERHKQHLATKREAQARRRKEAVEKRKAEERGQKLLSEKHAQSDSMEGKDSGALS